MRRLFAVLMTALLVTSAAGAAMVIGAPAAPVDDGDLRVVSLGVDDTEDVSVYRIDNLGNESAQVTLSVYGSSQSETLTVDADSSTEVAFDGAGDKTVILSYEGDDVDRTATNPKETFYVDDDKFQLTSMSVDSEDDLAKFRATNDNDENVTVSWDVYGTDQGAELTLNASETKYFVVETNDDGDATVRLLYDGDVVETSATNNDEKDLGNDGEDLTLTAISTDTVDDLAKFRVTNDNAGPVSVEYDVYGTEQNGTLSLNASETKYFVVETNDDGEATARLFYNDEQVDVKASNTQSVEDLGEPNVDTDALTLTSICSVEGDAKFRVTNDNDVSVTVSYDKYGTDVEGELTVDADDEAYFTVPENDDGATTVRLFYEGEEITVKAASGTPCEAPDDGEDGMDDGDDSDNGDGMDGEDGIDDGDESDNGDGMDGDMGDGEEMPAYQIDVAAGGVIENLGVDGDDADDEADFYGTQGRLLQAQTVLENGTVTGTHMVPTENVTKSLAGCHVTYTPVSYDGETGEATLTVSVDGDADCEDVTLTLAGYELPGDDTTFVRENADDQELVDYVTVTLENGDSGTVTVDLTDDAAEA